MRNLWWILTLLLGIISALWFCLVGCFGLLTFTGLADEPTSIWTFWRSATVIALSLLGLVGFTLSLWLARRLRLSAQIDQPGARARGFEVQYLRRLKRDG